MIIAFLLTVILATVVAGALTRTGKGGTSTATAAATAIALTVSLVFQPLDWDSQTVGELLLNRVVLLAAFAFAAAAFGKWTRPGKAV